MGWGGRGGGGRRIGLEDRDGGRGRGGGEGGRRRRGGERGGVAAPDATLENVLAEIAGCDEEGVTPFLVHAQPVGAQTMLLVPETRQV